MPRICEENGAGNGLVFPFIDGEYAWPTGLRAIVYGFGLVYFFLGVAIIADIFMAAIEKVTAKRSQRISQEGQRQTSKVWNDTVATLTLMALGSSAPEIFLSVIDIVKKEFHFGALGPSTIVGSAAFNLFVIIAVCVVVIPPGEVRVIDNLPAFYITALFSLGAYVWMAFILTHSSPSRVDIWEALVTALLLPVLIGVSYKVDTGKADWILQKIGMIPKEEEEATSTDGAAGGEQEAQSLLKFSQDTWKVSGSKDAAHIELVVKRTGSCSEPVTVSYHTEEMSAVPGFDYEEAEGQVEFAAGETEQKIKVEVLPRTAWRKTCQLLVLLEEPEGPAGFDEEDDGGEEAAIATVVLEALAGSTGPLGMLDSLLSLRMLQAGCKDWKGQMVGVFYCNGSPEEQAEASRVDWAMHLFSFPWKLFFSMLPPTTFFGGWVSFYASLGGIAVITACVSDLAELFGCVLNVPDIVTAVTFVALGTSMPDLFASISAAKEDPSADASIVNVTGSNSVNVFLGLGVPWTIAAVYWKVKGRTDSWTSLYPEMAASLPMGEAAFVVESKNLGFSVLTFCVICCVALLILHLRRRWLGGELGGPMKPKIMTFVVLVGFWGGWVSVVSWRVVRWQVASKFELMAVQGSSVVLLSVTTLVAIFLMRSYRGVVEEAPPSEEEGTDRAAIAEKATAELHNDVSMCSACIEHSNSDHVEVSV